MPRDPEAGQAPTALWRDGQGRPLLPTAASAGRSRGTQSQSLSPLRGLPAGPTCLGDSGEASLGSLGLPPLSVLTLSEVTEGVSGTGRPPGLLEPGPEAVDARASGSSDLSETQCLPEPTAEVGPSGPWPGSPENPLPLMVGTISPPLRRGGNVHTIHMISIGTLFTPVSERYFPNGHRVGP
ncbi:hypothetical protein P7K49_032373 [Saguinus oedipus]|uniref:Uncharacterized protein n=1 Tax=Saguinus oedipus TaxID=9490 RepID=A0ABQ9TZY5_SAGOE|nr:hypothetical protein P7K49_032373 [Saguinus oedipus]